jgi:CRP/FNR family transcriptional regulator, cyclic AMP receptor protein
MNEILEILPQVSFLADEDEETRRSFAALGTSRSFPRNNILFHHEDPCHAAYLVISGKIKLTLSHEDGRELTLDTFGPGGICGLIASIDGRPQTGTAITMKSSRIAILPREPLARWIGERPALQGRILLQIVELLRTAYGRVGSQALLSVKHRLREALLELARADGAVSAAEEIVVARPTHQELAERVGSTRVVVSRAIKALLEEEEGISMEGRVLRVRLRTVETDPPLRMRARM